MLGKMAEKKSEKELAQKIKIVERMQYYSMPMAHDQPLSCLKL